MQDEPRPPGDIEVTLNGEQRQIPAGLHVGTLLDHLRIEVRAVAVEVNRRIVRRADHPTTLVSAGDTIEIVSFVGGG